MMKTILLRARTTVIGALIVLTAASVSQASYIEKFDTNNAGTVAGRIQGSYTNLWGAAWHSTGGNSGGCISFPAGTDSDRLWWVGMTNPANYDFSHSKWLTIDLKIDGTITSPNPMLVRFYINSINDHLITKDSYSYWWNSATGWVTFGVPLIKEAFTETPFFPNTLSFEQILANPTGIGVSFEATFDKWGLPNEAGKGITGSTGTRVYLDNYGTIVPEPGCILTFLVGISAVGFKCRRRS